MYAPSNSNRSQSAGLSSAGNKGSRNNKNGSGKGKSKANPNTNGKKGRGKSAATGGKGANQRSKSQGAGFTRVVLDGNDGGNQQKQKQQRGRSRSVKEFNRPRFQQPEPASAAYAPTNVQVDTITRLQGQLDRIKFRSKTAESLTELFSPMPAKFMFTSTATGIDFRYDEQHREVLHMSPIKDENGTIVGYGYPIAGYKLPAVVTSGKTKSHAAFDRATKIFSGYNIAIHLPDELGKETSLGVGQQMAGLAKNTQADFDQGTAAVRKALDLAFGKMEEHAKSIREKIVADLASESTA